METRRLSGHPHIPLPKLSRLQVECRPHDHGLLTSVYPNCSNLRANRIHQMLQKKRGSMVSDSLAIHLDTCNRPVLDWQDRRSQSLPEWLVCYGAGNILPEIRRTLLHLLDDLSFDGEAVALLYTSIAKLLQN